MGAARERLQTVPFTGEELRSFMGVEGVQLTGSGVVPAGEPPLDATPGLEASMVGDLEIVVRIGDGGSNG